MKVDGKHFRSIWLEPDGFSVSAIDQRRLPHEFVVADIPNAEAAADAIRTMLVRGAPLIGATAAYGIALAMRDDRSDASLDRAYETLVKSRPTAINLKWALDEMVRTLRPVAPSSRMHAAYARAVEIADEDARRLAANAVCLGNTLVLSACSDDLRARLAEHGYRVRATPLGSFLRSGGSAFCLTLRLDRRSASGRSGMVGTAA